MSNRRPAAVVADQHGSAGPRARAGRGRGPEPGSIHHLQRTIGNQAFRRMLAPPPAAGTFVGRADDHSERDADQRADRVPRAQAPADALAPPGGPSDVAGAPLPASARAFFESRLGAPLGQVRIHTDARGAESAARIGARAYTAGNDIVFGHGQYAPHTPAGWRLLTHELAHVAQGAGPGAPIRRQAVAPGVPAPVLPIADRLDYDRIAQEVRNGVRGWGTDEEGVYRALQRLGRDPDAIARLRAKYREKYDADLEGDLRGDFSGGELRYALQLVNRGDAGSEQAARSAPPATEAEWVEAADRLHRAVEGWRTDEEAIYAVLLPFGRNIDKLNLLKIYYRQEHGEWLPDLLRSEMRGSELAYALWLLGEQTLERHDRAAEAKTLEVLAFVKKEAAARAKRSFGIDPGSKFYQRLRTKYLADYFASPTAAKGKEAAEEKIGAALEGRPATIGGLQTLEVRVKGGAWRPVTSRWEVKAITWLNQQKLPSQLGRLKSLPMFANVLALPMRLGAATDILGKENTDVLPFLDIPFLVGGQNPEIADFDADVRRGGTNISQLMHWGTGVRYAAENQLGLRELFLAYELWHLEGFDVFGQDSINDMISENQGRMLGAELMKGSAGALRSEADLLPFLNRSFMESRAWVGALLRMRRDQLDAWIIAKEQKAANMHYMDKDDVWHSLTVYQQLVEGASVEDVKRSLIVTSAIEIYALLYEADEWERANGPIVLTPLEKALIQGKLDKLLEIMAKAEVGKATTVDLLKARSQVDDLR